MKVQVFQTSPITASPGAAIQYYQTDVQHLKNNGADDVEQVPVAYDTSSGLALFGKKAGVRMDDPNDWIALPCPEYCKGKGSLVSFDAARALVTGS